MSYSDAISCFVYCKISSGFLINADLSNDGEKAPIPSSVGENDLLIVGPGVLGRIVAEKWKKVSV